MLTPAALGVDALVAAYAALRKRKQTGGDQDTKIVITPRVLLTPSALWSTAEELCYSATKPGQSNPNLANPIARRNLMPVDSPYLDDISTTRWWLFADPAEAPVFEATFYQGQQTPIINELPGDSAQVREWEVLHDCNVTAIDPYGAVTNQGQ